MANTIETTVIVEVAMLVRMACATCGSACEGNSASGTNERISGKRSSNAEIVAPATPRAITIRNGRTRKPPRKLYATDWYRIGSRLSILYFPRRVRGERQLERHRP